MHKLYLILFSFMLVSAVLLPGDTNSLAGKWEYSTTYQGKPFKLLAIFRTNGTYDGFINQKEFVSGTYRMNHDTLYIADPTCNAKYEGTYRVEFFGQRDSLKFHVLQDTCAGRREGTDGYLFKNITTKPKQ